VSDAGAGGARFDAPGVLSWPPAWSVALAAAIAASVLAVSSRGSAVVAALLLGVAVADRRAGAAAVLAVLATAIRFRTAALDDLAGIQEVLGLAGEVGPSTGAAASWLAAAAVLLAVGPLAFAPGPGRERGVWVGTAGGSGTRDADPAPVTGPVSGAGGDDGGAGGAAFVTGPGRERGVWVGKAAQTGASDADPAVATGPGSSVGTVGRLAGARYAALTAVPVVPAGLLAAALVAGPGPSELGTRVLASLAGIALAGIALAAGVLRLDRRAAGVGPWLALAAGAGAVVLAGWPA